MGRVFVPNSIGLSSHKLFGQLPQLKVLWVEGTTANPPVFAFQTLAGNPAGVVVAGTNTPAKALRSTNGGETWSTVGFNAGGSTVIGSGLAYDSQSALFMACDAGYYATSPDGLNWTDLANFATGVGILLAKAGRFVVWGSSVQYTDNAGATAWHVSSGVPAFTVAANQFTDGQTFAFTANVTGTGNCILESADGNTFTAHLTATQGSNYSGLAGNGTLYACIITPNPNNQGNHVAVGNSWLALANTAVGIKLPAFANGDPALNSCAVNNAGQIIVVGSYGSVMSSSDAGATWTEESVTWPHAVVGSTIFATHNFVNGFNALFITTASFISGLRTLG